jgi:hypothetical protein
MVGAGFAIVFAHAMTVFSVGDEQCRTQMKRYVLEGHTSCTVGLVDDCASPTFLMPDLL